MSIRKVTSVSALSQSLWRSDFYQRMTSEIIRNVSDTGALFGSFLEARSRIRVGEKKVLIPVNHSQQKLLN